MKNIVQEESLELQSQPKCIRNICILAHVDHGKTTLADALVASNGIISKRLAGKLRYLDSLPEEQLRGITMKSSAIALLFKNDPDSYLINLIDSPGHIDFSSEVSTAVRLCDGALVVVDVVEGVCPQTHAVLRQAWLEDIKPCLVLNKIDRLITELKQSPLEAFTHLQKILEQVNAITGTLFSSDILEKTSQKQNESQDVGSEHVFDWSSGLEKVDDSSLYFSPDQGNVVFASAIDGWGFRLSDFADLYSKKIGIRSDVLGKTLWGDYFLHNKSKRIMKGAQAKAKKPLFVQFILNYIWEIYEAVSIRDKERVGKIVTSLDLKIPARDSRQSDTKIHLQAIFRQWLPLSKTVLQMIVEKLPSPLHMSSERVEKLMCSGLKTFDSLPEQTKQLKGAFLSCSSEDGAPVIVFVSKMFAVDENVLPQNKRRPLTQEELVQRREQARLKHAEMLTETKEKSQVVTPATKSEMQNLNQSSNANLQSQDKFIAFARVYSGVIKKGQQLFVLGPKYDPGGEDEMENELEDVNEKISSEGNSEGLSAAGSVDRRESGKHVTCFTVKNLYLLMGRELEALDVVPAGNILGIGGLENHILKSATISSTLACPAFTTLPFDVRPIVRVAVEPLHPSNMSALRRGMCLLNQADPIVEVLVQETGEYVLVGTGEVHIQRCVDDLKKRYANVELKVSDPIIPFRETVVLPPKVDMVNELVQNEFLPVGKATSKDREKNEVQPTSWSETDHHQIESEQMYCGNLVDLKTGLLRAQTGDKRCSILIRACPLPKDVTRLLDSNTSLLKDIQSLRKNTVVSESTIKGSALERLKELYEKLKTAFDESGKMWQGAVDKIWAFGPRNVGPNVLLNKIPGYKRPSIWQGIAEKVDEKECLYSRGEYDNSVINGFLLATSAGPLCEEPLMGVCFVIENISIDYGEDESSSAYEFKKTYLSTETNFEVKKDKLSDDVSSASMCNSDDKQDLGKISENAGQQNTVADDRERGCSKDETPPEGGNRLPGRKALFGVLSGQIISTVKDGCRQAFSLQPARLMAAMYTCTIQTPADVLGKMYAVISKREGRVLGEEMKEGSDVFMVNAELPVAESFGFTEEIRKRTSGLARPLLQFTHWEIIDIDPYWVPTTEEEYTHFGEKADSENQARKYMNSVRRRKGLYVEAKTVEHAEKQRTLKK